MRKFFIFFALFAAMYVGADDTVNPLDDNKLTCEEMRAYPELFFETGVDLGSGSGSPNKVEYECSESIRNLPFMSNLLEMA
ncbi:MAG: hypothetical protein LBL65_00940 [Campylobacteraceae bacterium]|jgi:hypothetical protein|nr:hypothetical protein [Campylobacteraceae bacterium]